MSRRRSLVITTGIVVATALATVAAVASPPGRPDTGRAHAVEHMGDLDPEVRAEMDALMDGDATVGEMHQWMAEQDLAPAHMHHAPDAPMDHGAMHGRGTGSMHGHGTRDGSHA